MTPQTFHIYDMTLKREILVPPICVMLLVFTPKSKPNVKKFKNLCT